MARKLRFVAEWDEILQIAIVFVKNSAARAEKDEQICYVLCKYICNADKLQVIAGQWGRIMLTGVRKISHNLPDRQTDRQTDRQHKSVYFSYRNQKSHSGRMEEVHFLHA